MIKYFQESILVCLVNDNPVRANLTMSTVIGFSKENKWYLCVQQILI